MFKLIYIVIVFVPFVLSQNFSFGNLYNNDPTDDYGNVLNNTVWLNTTSEEAMVSFISNVSHISNYWLNSTSEEDIVSFISNFSHISNVTEIPNEFSLNFTTPNLTWDSINEPPAVQDIYLQYDYLETEKNFQSASEYCTEKHQNLLEIHDDKWLKRVGSFIKHLDLENDPAFWLDAKRDINSTEFIWKTTKKDVVFPIVHFGMYENQCLIIRNGTFYSWACDEIGPQTGCYEQISDSLAAEITTEKEISSTVKTTSTTKYIDLCNSNMTYEADGHSYWFQKNLYNTFHGAQTYCESLDMTLLEIHSETDNWRVYNLYDRIRACIDATFWLGSHRNERGDFRWKSNDELLTYTNFDSGEPNNHAYEEHCLQVAHASHYYKWNDNRCSRSFNFICWKGPEEQKIATTELPEINLLDRMNVPVDDVNQLLKKILYINANYSITNEKLSKPNINIHTNFNIVNNLYKNNKNKTIA